MPTSMVAAETLPPTHLRKHMKLWEKLEQYRVETQYAFLDEDKSLFLMDGN